MPTAAEARALQFVEAFNTSGIDAVLEFFVDDFTWYAAPGWPGKPEYGGPDGARELAGEWTENFLEYRWETHAAEEHGERVLLLATQRGRSREGVPVASRVAGLLDVAACGRFGDCRFFFSWDEARAALE